MLSRSSDRRAWADEDPLSTVLLDLRLAGTFFCSARFDAAWSLAIPERDFASFHFVAAGPCWLQLLPARGRAEPVRMGPGDLALVPRSPPQLFSSNRRRTGTPVERFPLRRLSDAVSTFHPPGAAGRWHVVCGGVRLEGVPATMLLDALPDVVVLRAGDASPIVGSALSAMREESQLLRAGGATLMTRLADVIVLHAIRSWIERSAVATGWLSALRDAQLGRALAEVHRRPERAWSVAALAAIARLSRSRFTQRFSALVGETPMQYVTQVRMQRAVELLRAEKVGIAEVAQRLGYDSEPAFARAFKRHVGRPPGAVRREPRP